MFTIRLRSVEMLGVPPLFPQMGSSSGTSLVKDGTAQVSDSAITDRLEAIIEMLTERR
jgi:hypothetical protein